MYSNVFRRILALSVALIIFIFSCGYVAFSNEKSSIHSYKNLQPSVFKSKQSPFAKKFLHHPRLAINKKMAVGSAACFFTLLFFLGYKNAVVNTKPYLNHSQVFNNLNVWLSVWRI